MHADPDSGCAMQKKQNLCEDAQRAQSDVRAVSSRSVRGRWACDSHSVLVSSSRPSTQAGSSCTRDKSQCTAGAQSHTPCSVLT